MLKNQSSKLIALVATLVLIGGLLSPAFARGPRGGFGRSGSFGGGGGGFGRSYSGGGSFGGGGSFNAPRSSGSSSFGSSRSSFGSSRSSSGGSFNRSGSFGNSGRISSTSVNAPPAYRGITPSYYNSRAYYGGGYYPVYGYGGYGDYWFHPSWYYWLPFHPAFYYSQPYMYGGAYYPGGFSFTRLIMGIAIIVFVLWLLSKIFGGGKGVKYTSYR